MLRSCGSLKQLPSKSKFSNVSFCMRASINWAVASEDRPILRQCRLRRLRCFASKFVTAGTIASHKGLWLMSNSAKRVSPTNIASKIALTAVASSWLCVKVKEQRLLFLRKKFNRIVKDSGSVPKELRERSRLDTLQY